jgi:hypothetical protein
VKMAVIILLGMAYAAPALAADQGPSKKALAAMAQDERETCATNYLTFAFGGRVGTQLSIKRNGLPADTAKLQDKASDAFQLRGMQFLNADAKLGDVIPKHINDAAQEPADRLLVDNELVAKVWGAIKSCNAVAGIREIDMQTILTGK